MRLDPASTVVGIPILAVRDLLRRGQGRGGIDAHSVMRQLGVSPRRAEAIIRALEADGYVEPLGEHGPPGPSRWTLTLRGSALSKAHARRVRRATAERLLTDLTERARQTSRTDCPLAFVVREIVVFGSYLTDEPTLGDLDLAVRWAPRHADLWAQQRHREARIAAARASGRKFATRFDERSWPEREAVRFLRGGSRSLDLMNLDSIRKFIESQPHRVIYLASDQRNRER